ncbi:MAG: zinc-ribbon domain-containing protein [Promethearchaeota archaeon]
MPKYCSDCGDEITDPSQNFCEKCGAPIPKDDKLKEETSLQPISTKNQYISGSLFDINRNYYILKEKYWDF